VGKDGVNGDALLFEKRTQLTPYTEAALSKAFFNKMDDDEDTKFILLKIWCHGQSVAPPILGLLCLFSRTNVFESALIMIFLLVWPMVSWRAMQRPSSESFASIFCGGLLVQVLYGYIIMTTPLHKGGFSPLVFIAAALLAIETFAYLVVTWCHRGWFVRQAVDGSLPMAQDYQNATGLYEKSRLERVIYENRV
jgi:hypothetical protein